MKDNYKYNRGNYSQIESKNNSKNVENRSNKLMRSFKIN